MLFDDFCEKVLAEEEILALDVEQSAPVEFYEQSGDRFDVFVFLAVDVPASDFYIEHARLLEIVGQVLHNNKGVVLVAGSVARCQVVEPLFFGGFRLDMHLQFRFFAQRQFSVERWDERFEYFEARLFLGVEDGFVELYFCGVVSLVNFGQVVG